MATTWIVDTATGLDTAPGAGTLSQPYLTVAKAVSVAASGDQIHVRGGTTLSPVYCNQQIILDNKPNLTIRNYGSEIVCFRGITNTKYIAHITDSANVTITGLWFQYNPSHGYSAGKKWAYVFFDGSSTSFTIQNCKIFKAVTAAARWSASYNTAMSAEYNGGYREVGIQVGTGANDGLISTNEIYGTNKGFQVNGRPLRLRILDNHAHDTVQSNLDFVSGGGLEQGTLVEGNNFDGSFMEDNIQFHPLVAGAIEIVGVIIRYNICSNAAENAIDLKGTAQITIEGNVIYQAWGSNNGFLASSGSNRNSLITIIKGALATENASMHIVRNNIMYDAQGINILPKSSYYNNTIIANRRDYTGGNSSFTNAAIPPWFGLRQQDNYVDVFMTIVNNLIANMTNGCSIALRTGMVGQTFYINHNAHVGCSPAIYTGSSWSLRTEAQWEADTDQTGWTGHEASSLFTLSTVAQCLLENASEAPTGNHEAYNFGVKTTSPLYQAGGHVTYAGGIGTNTTQLAVANPYCFMDGYGVTTGDSIYLEGAGARTITDVNYNTGVLTLNLPASWANNARVWWRSATPNIGADAFGESSDPGPDPGEGGEPGSGEFMVHRFDQTDTATQNVTLPSPFGIAPNAGIFVTSLGVTDETAADGASLGIGFWAGTTNLAVAVSSEHNVASTDTYRHSANAGSIFLINATTGAIVLDGAITATDVGDIDIAWATHSATAYKVSAALFSVENVYCAEIAIPQTSGASVTVTPNFRPDVTFLITNGKLSDSVFGNARMSIGIATYDGATLTQHFFTLYYQDGQATPNAAANMATTYIGGECDTAGTISRAIEMGTPSATDFTLTTRLSSWGDADVKAFVLCLKMDGLAASLTIQDTPTATDTDHEHPVGLESAFAFVLGTHLTATVAATPWAGKSNAEAGVLGVGFSDMVRQYSTAIAHEDKSGAANSNTQSITDDRIMQLPLDTGAAGQTAALAATPATDTDLHLNHSVVLASVRKWMFLNIAAPAEVTVIAPGNADMVFDVVDPIIPLLPGNADMVFDVVDPTVLGGTFISPGNADMVLDALIGGVLTLGPGLVTLDLPRRPSILIFAFEDDMSASREVVQSPVEQGSAETKLWTIEVPESWGTVIAVTSTTLKLLNVDGTETDVSSTSLTGTASTSGQILLPKLVTALTDNCNYILRVVFSAVNAQVEEAICRIICRD